MSSTRWPMRRRGPLWDTRQVCERMCDTATPLDHGSCRALLLSNGINIAIHRARFSIVTPHG
ncbi:hypothetical protein LPH52_00130 [Xylella taiwanensis]|uniref:hypothetical protein n=1 Tax=Xylella taiwanensis TaxID=1444770 RepID=UPI001E383D28|nr:hypothetical protein [Xylella taiwanensis]MCD8455293.1 hypothetical protein [Xylella taiwanensis]MCD8464340.1 hypothetical protein [Xylella taiwanensis]UFM94568.1 hypothetical protein LPH39_04775 [Xylella taiwanensis]